MVNFKPVRRRGRSISATFGWIKKTPSASIAGDRRNSTALFINVDGTVAAIHIGFIRLAAGTDNDCLVQTFELQIGKIIRWSICCQTPTRSSFPVGARGDEGVEPAINASSLATGFRRAQRGKQMCDCPPAPTDWHCMAR